MTTLARLAVFVSLISLSGCFVEEHRTCARGERWDGRHCMVDRRYHDHDHDRDHREGEGGVIVRDHR